MTVTVRRVTEDDWMLLRCRPAREDAGRKRQLWSPEAESWFPGGPDDPAMALVRVRIIQADCWDVRRNAVNHLFKLDTSAMTYRPAGQASSTTRH